jgi:hypothetical protein
MDLYLCVNVQTTCFTQVHARKLTLRRTCCGMIGLKYPGITGTNIRVLPAQVGLKYVGLKYPGITGTNIRVLPAQVGLKYVGLKYPGITGTRKAYLLRHDRS